MRVKDIYNIDVENEKISDEFSLYKEEIIDLNDYFKEQYKITGEEYYEY